MPRSVVFLTPGLIDIRAFTHFGVNSKPVSNNPIGYFGTGLKYAIAVLCREKFRPVVWIGGVKYTFKVKSSKFRDKDFDFVIMIKEEFSLGSLFRKREVQLPFTTELGKNWALWQAFRELHSNTLDEDGETFIELGHFTSVHNMTCIEVEGERFVKEFLDKDRSFLPEGMKLRSDSATLQVFDRPSEHIYYRGLRVLDLEKGEKTALTYNFLQEVELTEDRTAKNPYALKSHIEEWIVAHASAEQVAQVLAAPKDTLEGRLSYNYVYSTPTAHFKELARRGPHEGAAKLAKSYEPKAKKQNPFEHHPLPWSGIHRGRLLDANEMPVSKDLVSLGLYIINHYDYNNSDLHIDHIKELTQHASRLTSPSEEASTTALDPI